MSQTAYSTPVEAQLSPLQQEIYRFLTRRGDSSFKRQELMKNLNCQHQASFTRSLNQLAKRNLIEVHVQSDDWVVELPHPSTSTQSSESVIQLSLLSESMTMDPKDQTDLTRSNEELLQPIDPKPLPKVEALLSLEKGSAIKDIEVSQTTAVQSQIKISTVELDHTSTAEVKREESLIKAETMETTTSSTLSPGTETQLTESTRVSKADSTKNLTAPVVPAATTKPSKSVKAQTPSWVTSFNALSKQTKKLFERLLKACLTEKTWSLSNYKAHIQPNELTSKPFKKKLQQLNDAGFIQLSGAKLGRLTLQYSPLELCEHLTNLQPIYTQQRALLTQIDAAFHGLPDSTTSTANSSTKPPKEPVATPKAKESPKSTASTTQATIEIPVKTTQAKEDPFEKRYYLLDSENCHQFLTSPSFLKQLKDSDRFVIFLSQNSPPTHPAVLHFVSTHSDQIETRYVIVRGKGESDLDHVITMELSYLWMKDSEAQYIILSKDQGFLASLNYWTQRHQLKPKQLCLKTTLN